MSDPLRQPSVGRLHEALNRIEAAMRERMSGDIAFQEGVSDWRSALMDYLTLVQGQIIELKAEIAQLRAELRAERGS